MSASSSELASFAMWLLAKVVQNICRIWLYLSYQIKDILRLMTNRREVLQAALASMVPFTRGWRSPNAAGMTAIYQRDLPRLNLDGWEVTVVELTFPPRNPSTKHRHPGFVIGYVLEGSLLFQVEGEPEKILARGEVFFEPVGAVHARAESASATRPARVVALVFGEKGKPLTSLP